MHHSTVHAPFAHAGCFRTIRRWTTWSGPTWSACAHRRRFNRVSSTRYSRTTALRRAQERPLRASNAAKLPKRCRKAPQLRGARADSIAFGHTRLGQPRYRANRPHCAAQHATCVATCAVHAATLQSKVLHLKLMQSVALQPNRTARRRSMKRKYNMAYNMQDTTGRMRPAHSL